ncbi:MAG: hypothetical protein HQL60_02910 [Magnetococcales bacterium]|nr:hypothetical protein [Magnetococcales bacterium]
MERQLWQEMQQLEENKRMPYVTSVERFGIEKGLEEGHKEGNAEFLLRQLYRRFQILPGWVEKKVLNAKIELLGGWTDRILDAHSLEDIFGDEAQQVTP